MQGYDKPRVEKIFTDLNTKSKDETVRARVESDVRKRVLLSSHFGTAFKAKKVENMLFEMKEVQKNYPLLVKTKENRNYDGS